MKETRKKFILAQVEVGLILIIAHIGNNWEPNYPSNDNHNPSTFWTMTALVFVAALFTLKHTPKDRVTVLNRSQTEEWKGWMQLTYIMCNYHGMGSLYNTIRLFDSSYVWMTGFGNYLYFDNKRDFTLQRVLSMWVRINYFPLLLVLFVRVPLHIFYVVPLHTVGFFITMFTCYFGHILETKHDMSYWKSRSMVAAICGIGHILFYETDIKKVLLIFGEEAGNEYIFRFSSDKYSLFLGILCAMARRKICDFVNFHHVQNPKMKKSLTQIMVGASMIAFWWVFFGSIPDKFVYNAIHPYIFWIPLAGFALIRNSSKYLSELHSTVLDSFGRITLETYVLQFHLLMNKNAQNIPIVIPNSGPDGNPFNRALNMALSGTLFFIVAFWAHNVTATTQSFIVDFVTSDPQKTKQLSIFSSNNKSDLELNKLMDGDHKRKVEKKLEILPYV